MIFISRNLYKTTFMWDVMSLNLDRVVELTNVELFFIFKENETRFYSWSSMTPIPIRIVSETLRAKRFQNFPIQNVSAIARMV